MKLLIIEDERELSGSIAAFLNSENYLCEQAFTFGEAMEKVNLYDYDCILLDLMLPGGNGLDVLREIRRKDVNIKILILSARSAVDDRIIGLDEGANDYLVKPFDFGELEARIRNLLRREFSQIPTTVTLGLLALDTKSKQVSYDGTEINLTRKEYGILEYLMIHKNQVVSAEEMTEHVWNHTFDPFSNTFRYHIHSLKKKLHTVSALDCIKTVRGQGYVMEDKA